MSAVEQFIQELEAGTLKLTQARRIYEQLETRLTAEEKAKALTAIARLEVYTRQQLRTVDLLQTVPDGWLKNYLGFCTQSESPDTFNFFSAVAVLTHMLGRSMWVRVGHKQIFPPLSVFLVSPAGVARRSTAILTAADIGQRAGAMLLMDRATPEGLMDWLEEAPRSLLVADEAATLLSKRDYMVELPQLLCRLMDCPRIVQRKLKGQLFEVHEPTLNLLLGCAPDWIINAMPSTAVGGGMLSRMIMVYEPGRKMLIPFPERVGTSTLDTLATDLRLLSDKPRGEIVYDDAGRDLFVTAYAGINRQMQESSDKMASYLSRKPDHLHRMSMALIAASGAPSVITADILERALGLLSLVEEGMESALRVAGLERPGVLQQRVLSVLAKRRGWTEYSQLMRAVSWCMDGTELRRVLTTLKESNLIRDRIVVKGTRLVRSYSTTQ